jgi:cation diffusion facilitator family transporter
MISASEQNIRFQKLITIVAVVLFFGKLTAWYLSGSVAILTDALESTVNIVSAMVGVYSLSVAARPKDYNHPYGHGKAEFLSAAFEGSLIILAGFFIIYEAILHLQHPVKLKKLDEGILLVFVTAIINYAFGVIAVKQGGKNKSLALIASGKHLKTDTYSTIGIVIGLLLIYITKLEWIDSVVAIIFSFIILFTGFRIIRSSVSGIMDEADADLLNEIVQYLNENRKENWIDLHNLRIIKYGSVLHLDCHMTVPWFLNVHQAHAEIDELSRLIKDKYGASVELFVHTDGCMEFSCRICIKSNCDVRQHALKKRILWNVENISSNIKHGIDEGV